MKATTKYQIKVCSFCDRSREEVQNIFKGPGVNVCDECLVAGRLKDFDPHAPLSLKYLQLTDNAIEQLIQEQYYEEGRVDDAILDILIDKRRIDLTRFKDQNRIRELWRKLVLLSILNPDGYKEALEYIKTTADRLKKDDIPDIPA